MITSETDNNVCDFFLTYSVFVFLIIMCMTCHAFIIYCLISRQGSYKLIESDEQWKLIQEQRNVSQHRSGHRSASAHSRKGDASQHQKSTSPIAHSSSGVANMSDGGGMGTRKSGYVNSGAETETEMMSISSMKRTRRRR